MDMNILLIIMIVGLGALMFFQSRKQKKAAMEQEDFRNKLSKGDPVMTSSGLFGVVDSSNDESIVITLEDGSKSRWVKAAITTRPGTSPAELVGDRTDPVVIENVDSDDDATRGPSLESSTGPDTGAGISKETSDGSSKGTGAVKKTPAKKATAKKKPVTKKPVAKKE
jgi:preprotein translocase subunit YajC